MELIELLIWIFKAFFGEQEKPADMTPTARTPTPRKKRGTYVYGDESGQPRTLEDILEEARRQAQQKRDGGATGPARLTTSRKEAANAPVPVPKGPAAAPKEAARRVARRVELDAPDPSMQRSAPATVEAIKELVAAPLTAAQDGEPQQADGIERATKRNAHIPVQNADGAKRHTRVSEQQLESHIKPESPDKFEKPRIAAARTAAPARTVDPGVLDILKALRAATPAQKRLAARQGLIMNEIFGPPRSRRPYRPGQRMM